MGKCECGCGAEVKKRLVYTHHVRSKLSIEERFWSKVQILGPNDCWPWLAYKDPKTGYGKFMPVSRKNWLAHRFAYLLHYKTEPGELDVCHTCDNPPCCNPAHLFLGTHVDNMIDMRNKGRQAKDDGMNLKPRIKFSNEDVNTIRKLFKNGTKVCDIMTMFSISRRHARDIVDGKVRQNV